MKKTSIFILILTVVLVNCQFAKTAPLPNSPLTRPVIPLRPAIKTPLPIISLSNHIKSYKQSYLNVFMATLSVLSDNSTVTSYNSTKGEIRARLKNGKELFILIASFQDNLTKVRITPADGVYDLSVETLNEIFNKINLELRPSEKPYKGK